MDESTVKKRVLALRRLIIAATTFDHVSELCAHIERLGPKTSTPLHVTLCAGVSVTYIKPFLRNDGLGPLPPKFSTFPNAPDHEKTHKDLKNGRDWYYAHRDMLRSPTLLKDSDPSTFGDVKLCVHEDGTISFSVHEQTWRIESFPRVRSLCDYQKARIDKDIIALVNTLGNNQRLPIGKHVIGRDFP